MSAPANRSHIGPEPLDATALGAIAEAVQHGSAGAVVLFQGNVRDLHQARSVRGITYTAYQSMAEKRLLAIVEELSVDGVNLAIHHRIGTLSVGETSVVIAASSAHREEAYRASRTALERLKAEVPIWKREHYADGESTWREEESLQL